MTRLIRPPFDIEMRLRCLISEITTKGHIEEYLAGDYEDRAVGCLNEALEWMQAQNNVAAKYLREFVDIAAIDNHVPGELQVDAASWLEARFGRVE